METKEMKTTNSNNQKESKTMKDNQREQKQTAPAPEKATETMKETTNNSNNNQKDNNEVKAMKENKSIEQQLQELEDQKKALKEQLTEQKRAQRVANQLDTQVVDLLKRYTLQGLQLSSNARAVAEVTEDKNLTELATIIDTCTESLATILTAYSIDIDALRGAVKPLTARGNKTDRTPREQRKLADYGIKDGDRLIYAPTGDAYEVLDNGVIVDGTRYALSTAVKILQNNPGGNYSGYRFFRLPDHTEVLEKTAVIS